MTKTKHKQSIIEEYLAGAEPGKELPPQANYLLMLYYYSKGEYRQGLEELVKAIKKEGQRWDFYQDLVYLGKKAKDFKPVYSELELAMDKHKDNHNLHSYLGLAYLLDKKLSEAIDQFQKAISLNDDLGMTHFYLGIAYLECICASNPDKEKNSLLNSLAHQEFSKANESKCVCSDKFASGINLLGQSKHQPALEEFKHILEEELSVDLVFGRFEEVVLSFFMAPQTVNYERIQQAIEELDKRTVQPGDMRVSNRLGIAYLLFFKLLFSEAKNCFEQARTIAPKFHEPTRNLKFLKDEEKEFSSLFEFLRF